MPGFHSLFVSGSPLAQNIIFEGWTALTFHSATLESTKDLLVLKLSTARQEGYCFISPADELDEFLGCGSSAGPVLIERPQWTWDWHLSRLLHIQPMSEFTYLFEFKVLQGCLSLLTLHLYIPTVDGNHTRIISGADLFITGPEGSQERNVAPALRGLHINRRWMIESPSLFSQFLGKMFPKLERLVMRGFGGTPVGSMVGAIRTMANHVKVVRMDLEGPSMEEGVELGMFRRSEKQRRRPKTLPARFLCTEEYVLYKDLA